MSSVITQGEAADKIVTVSLLGLVDVVSADVTTGADIDLRLTPDKDHDVRIYAGSFMLIERIGG